MSQVKRVVVLRPDDSVEVLPTLPTWSAMQALVGGYVEQVRILDRIASDGSFIYSYMYVNEEGLLRNMPRNQNATMFYQANVRMTFPGALNPFVAAKALAAQQAEALGAKVIETSEPVPGYADDPYIAGVAIYFQGYTCEEVTAYWNKEDEEGA